MGRGKIDPCGGESLNGESDQNAGMRGSLDRIVPENLSVSMHLTISLRNYRLENRMRENRQSGSEGGAKSILRSYSYRPRRARSPI